MTSPPWMPLYVGDFTADTMHLSTLERGMYISLIMHCWQHSVIPRSDWKLATIVGCDVRTWRTHKDTILAFFAPIDSVNMQHSRVTKELRRALELSNKRKAAAKKVPSKCSANAHTLIKKVSKSPSTASSQSAAKPQQAASDEASKTASRDVATDSLARSMQKRGRG